MKLTVVLAATLMIAVAPASAQTAPAAPAAATATATAPRHYTSADTDIGTLLDDPAAKALLAKHFPEMLKGDQIEQARSMTLKEVQPYAADMVTDAALASLDADLAKLPAKK